MATIPNLGQGKGDKDKGLGENIEGGLVGRINWKELPKQLQKGENACYCSTWIGELDDQNRIIPSTVRHAYCGLHSGTRQGLYPSQ